MATDYVDQVASSIIQQLKEGTAPWQKPWQPGERFMPYNPTTGNEYHGMNAMWLMSRAESQDLGDARWMTFRQAQEQDAHVRKGEKGTPIQFWKWQGLEPVRDASGKPVVDQEGQPVRQMVRYERPRVWSAVVFNAAQIEGLPPAPIRPVLPEWERHERAETILTNAGVPIRHTPGDRAFYRLSEDTITLPERGQFPIGDRYYATALHELGHATGHPSRLARDLTHPFGSEGYAREELRAEIGSLMLGEQLGIGHDPGQHVAYVAGWIKALEQDPREIFRAAADAEKITKMIRSFERVQEQTADQTQAAPAVTRQTNQEREPAMPTMAGSDATVRPPVMIRENSPAMQPPSPERTYLAVPYAEKDDAKQLGAKWDRAEKAWYVPAGADLKAFTPWLPAKGSVHIAVDTNPAVQFAEAIREAGLQLDGPPLMDGQLHRVPVEGDKGRDRSGAYTGHLDGRPAGFIQNYRTGVKQNWKASGQAAALGAKDRAQLAAETAQKRLDRAREREQQAERTAQQVDALWTAAAPAQAHPYLTDKGVQAHGLRQDEVGRLMVPVQDADGRMWSVQRIGKDGFKQFEDGGRVEGGHFVIGDVKRPGPLLIAEGFATAATLHEMTDMPSIVAFNAGNLLPVAQTYRGLYPDRAIYIAGDDDRHREQERDAQGRPKINVGRVKAEQAAEAIAGQAVFPAFPLDSMGTDWNDLAQTQGRSQAADLLRQAIAIGDREQAAQGLTAARDAAALDQDRALSPTLGHAISRTGKAAGRDGDRAQVQELGQDR
jgi:putative DNA primase/helicase